MFNRFALATAVVAALCSAPIQSFGQTNVLTQHNDGQRTGANTHETTLNVTAVKSADFGKLWEYPVRGRIYAQPLYVTLPQSPLLPNGGPVVIVATAENHVMAFDARHANPVPIWEFDAGPPAMAGRVYGSARQDITPSIGVIGTPVIDLDHFTLYFVAMTAKTADPNEDSVFHTLHAIDIRTGVPRGNTVINGSLEGGGDFNSRRENQRAALALVKDHIYIAWASFGDLGPFDGLMMSYDTMDSATPLAKQNQFQVARFKPTVGKRHKGGGIWQSGGGPAIDDSGMFLYVVTGNGDSSNDHAGSDFDSSVVKLDLKLNEVDYFTPSYQNFLNENDLDLSVAGPMIPPDQLNVAGKPVKLLLHGSKAGFLYVLDRDGLGRFHDSENRIIQTLRVFTDADDIGNQLNPSHIHTTPVFWNAADGPRVYVASDWNLGVRAYRFDHEKLNPNPVAANFFPRAPVSQLSLSSFGSQSGTGILWLISSPSGTVFSYPGILYAFNAQSLELIYSSESNPFDRLGDYPRFNAPTVAGGQVFVPTFSNKLVVYGLCSAVATTTDQPCRCSLCKPH